MSIHTVMCKKSVMVGLIAKKKFVVNGTVIVTYIFVIHKMCVIALLHANCLLKDFC